MNWLSRYAPMVLSALRVITALLFIQHGSAKFFHFPAIPAMAGITQFSPFGMIGLAEIVGGLLIALGLYSRWIAFLLSGEMAIAYFVAHAPHSFFPVINQGESAILFCFVFLYLAAAGPGSISLNQK